MSRQGLLVSRSICLLCAAVLMAAATLPVARATPADDARMCESASGDAAIAACVRAITSGEYQGRDLAELHHDLGIEYQQKSDYGRAIAAFSEAIRIDPSYPAAFFSRGHALSSNGDNDRAIADYSEAIRLNPISPNFYNNRGAAWLDKGDINRAIADYSEAIRLDPNDDRYYESRGKAWKAKGDWQRAKADFNEAIRLRALQ
jgi:tetratricopeptide (TPR) repeat protein